MYKKKKFIVFEGIEGSGKSLHSKYLIEKIKKLNIPYIYIREPGGTTSAEEIRKIILNNKNYKLDRLTDTLLYLAARNENFINNIKKNYNKKLIICDRFIDSTIAYQHYGLGVNKKIIESINKLILGTIKPDFTFLMKINIKESFKRLKFRRNLNRYDKFDKIFYSKVQNGFINISLKNKSKYMIINSENNILDNKKIILNRFKKLIK